MRRGFATFFVLLAACSVSEEPIYVDRACDAAHPCPDDLVCYARACASQAPIGEVDPGPVSNPSGDDDGDGLTNGEESTLGTDPKNADTDSDFVNDDVEVANFTNPRDPNADGDKLIDGAEYWSGTNCNLFDSDDDGIQDGDEDADGDGYTNYDETSVALDPRDPSVHP